MKISGNMSNTELKVTFVDIKPNSTAIGLVDSYKDFSGERKQFFWNCTCINKARDVAGTLKKGDLVNIKDADVSVRGTKGSMLVYNMVKSDKVIVDKSTQEMSQEDTEYIGNESYVSAVSDYSADVKEDEQF